MFSLKKTSILLQTFDVWRLYILGCFFLSCTSTLLYPCGCVAGGGRSVEGKAWGEAVRGNPRFNILVTYGKCNWAEYHTY